MKRELLEMTQHLVSISDLGRGKAKEIFDNVQQNNMQYVVLRNNKPIALIISIDSYSELLDAANAEEDLNK